MIPMRFEFPGELRPSTVDEREKFYRENFPEEEIRRRMDRWDVFIPVVDVGSETTRYRPRFRDYKGKLVRITDYDGLDDLKDRIVEYAPEDLYYVTTVEKEDRIETNPEMELVFDLDPEKVQCRKCDRKRKYLDEPASEYVFCRDCFADVALQARKLYAFLENHFSDLQLVYSGRGFHIHVEDEEAFLMDREDRRELAGKVAKKFPIDEKVTSGEKELIRLPGSLHGLVSRVVTAVEPDALYDPEALLDSKTVPGYISEDV